MKSYKNLSGSLVMKISAVCLVSIALSSCLKDNSITTTPPNALVSFVQASPDEPALDLYLNSNKVNALDLNYGNNIDYFKALAGLRTVNFYKSGTQNTVYSDTATFAANQTYSMFLVNVPAAPQLFVLKDTINQPAAGTASVRFVNLSPDAGAVDLAMQNGPVFVANRGFKGFSSFSPVTVNGTERTVEIRKAGTNTVLATLTNLNLTGGFVYTIWFHGLSAATASSSDALSVSIITNAFYN